MPKKLLAALFGIAALLSAAPSYAIQIGPVIKIDDGGNLCVGGGCVGPDGVKLPTVDELIDDAINTTPLTLLGDGDKAKLHNIIKTTGYVAAVVADPVVGTVIVTVLIGDKKQDVVVPTTNAPPTAKIWDFQADCIVQTSGKIMAMFNNDPPHLNKQDMTPGDTVNLLAPVCTQYGSNSVTYASVKFTGLTDVPDAVPPAYRHFLVGDPK